MTDSDIERKLSIAREALIRRRQGMQNILEFRKIAGSERYGSLTRDEIEACIEEINMALEQTETDTTTSKPETTVIDSGRQWQCSPIILGKCVGFVGGSMDQWPEICDRCGIHFNLHQPPENAAR